MSGINGMGAHSLTIPGHKLPLLDHFLPEYVSRKITKPPVVDMKNCDRCGICARICPVSAVEKEKLMVDGNVCLRCFRCVRTCKKKARSIEFNAKPIIPLFFTLKNKVKHAPVLYIWVFINLIAKIIKVKSAALLAYSWIFFRKENQYYNAQNSWDQQSNILINTHG